jgi:hypothetical protein
MLRVRTACDARCQGSVLREDHVVGRGDRPERAWNAFRCYYDKQAELDQLRSGLPGIKGSALNWVVGYLAKAGSRAWA